MTATATLPAEDGTLPDPGDIPAWRALLAGAEDHAASRALVRAWARAAGCTLGTGDQDHAITAPDGIDPWAALSLSCWAIMSGLSVIPPKSWPEMFADADSLREWERP